MRAVFASILFAAMGLSNAVASEKPTKATETKQVEKEPKVVKAQVCKSTKIFDLLSYPGELSSRVNATVVAEAQGNVEKIQVKLGQEVKKNQLLLTIRNTDPVYRYRAMRVLAPVSGIISQLPTSEGTLVTQGQSLLQITDPTKVRVTFNLPAADINLIHQNQPAEFELAGKNYKAKVTGISPVLDPATGTASAELELENGETIPTLGSIGRVNFKANEHQGVQIPGHVVSYEGRDPILYKIVDNKIAMTKIKLGNKRQGQVEITQRPKKW